MKLKKLTLLLAVCALFLVGCDRGDANNDNIIGNDDGNIEHGVDTPTGGSSAGNGAGGNMASGNSAGDNTPAAGSATEGSTGGMMNEAGNAVRDAVDGVGDAAKDLGRGAGDAIDDVGRGVDDAVKKAD